MIRLPRLTDLLNIAYLTFLGRIFLSAAVLGLGVYFLDFKQVLEGIQQVGAGAFLAAVAIAYAGAVTIPSLLTFQALSHKRISIPLNILFQINLAMRFYTLVLPKIVSMGVLWKRYRQHGETEDALALMLLERLIQLFVYLLTALLFFWVDEQASQAIGSSIRWIVVPIMGLVFLGALIHFGTLGRYLTRNDAEKNVLKNWTLKLGFALDEYQHLSRKNLVWILFLALLSYLLLIAGAYVLSESMGLGLSWSQLAWARTLIFLLVLFPFSVGGIGIREMGFVTILGLQGVGAEDAFSLGLAITGTQAVLAVLGLASELLRIRKPAN